MGAGPRPSEPSTPVPGSPSGASPFVSYLFLFQRDPRFQGPTEPRTPLGPLACSREECSLPATTMQLSRAEGPGLPARRLLATTTSHRAFACPGEDRSTHLRAHRPGPLCFKHTPLPTSLCVPFVGKSLGHSDLLPLPLATKEGGDCRPLQVAL